MWRCCSRMSSSSDVTRVKLFYKRTSYKSTSELWVWGTNLVLDSSAISRKIPARARRGYRSRFLLVSFSTSSHPSVSQRSRLLACLIVNQCSHQKDFDENMIRPRTPELPLSDSFLSTCSFSFFLLKHHPSPTRTTPPFYHVGCWRQRRAWN